MSSIWKKIDCFPTFATMSRRFFIPVLPIGHINGKIAPQFYKAHNTTDPDKKQIDGYFYGYRRRANPTKSCFGIRTNCRDLLVHPYTTEEQENRDLFTLSLLEVSRHWLNQEEKDLCITDFEKQTYYHTPRGFAVAMTRENGGEWPPEWTITNP